MTKPVTFGWSLNKENFGVASYPSALAELGLTNIYYATPNCSTFFDLDHPDTWRIPSSKPADGDETYRYNTLQVNNDFFGWEKSFFDSVKKRALHGSLPIFVPLSSGYDSGSICLALNELNVPYRSISIDSEENQEILAERIKINLRSSCVEHINLPALTQDECLEIKHMIENQCEPFKYIHSDQSLLDDDGALGAFRVATEAHRRGLLVCLSGCGADEIISDYGFNGIKHYPHSEFGGLFPDNLDTIFPWKKFYEDTMRSYLFKDELIFGIFGIEGRYPFLDRSLTQEFLSLSSKLKNSEYKSPITYILKKYHYPFEEGVKRGFSPYIKSNQNKSKNEIFKICFFEKLRKVIELIRKEK
jgi:asparagine synthetase B (glutamine-hydrolysing)